jgi:hypothetical protein
MAALTAAELAVNAPVNSASDSSSARSSPVFAWGRNESASIAEVAGPPSRRSSNDPSIDGRLQMVGWLPSDLHATMYTVGAAGSSSLQHMVMEPLQQAGFISVSTLQQCFSNDAYLSLPASTVKQCCLPCLLCVHMPTTGMPNFAT